MWSCSTRPKPSLPSPEWPIEMPPTRTFGRSSTTPTACRASTSSSRTTPSFLNSGSAKGAATYQALYRRIRDPLSGAGQSLHRTIIELPALSKDQYRLLAQRVRQIVEVGRGRQSSLTDDQIGRLADYAHERASEQLSTLVRSTVQLVDESLESPRINSKVPICSWWKHKFNSFRKTLRHSCARTGDVAWGQHQSSPPARTATMRSRSSMPCDGAFPLSMGWKSFSVCRGDIVDQFTQDLRSVASGGSMLRYINADLGQGKLTCSGSCGRRHFAPTSS